MPTPPDRARLILGIAGQLDAIARKRERSRPSQAPRPPRSPVSIRRHRRARHWKARALMLQNLGVLVAIVAAVAFIVFCYHALTIYGAREGYGTPHGGEARAAVALFAGGMVTGGCVVYVFMMARRGR